MKQERKEVRGEGEEGRNRMVGRRRRKRKQGKMEKRKGNMTERGMLKGMEERKQGA